MGRVAGGKRGGGGALFFDADDTGFVSELDGEDEELCGFLSLVREFEVDGGEIDIDRDHAEHGFLSDVHHVDAVDAGMGACAVFGGGGDELGEGVAELGVGGKDDAVVVTEGKAAEVDEVVDVGVGDDRGHEGGCGGNGFFGGWGVRDDWWGLGAAGEGSGEKKRGI